jgi:hypothetical protein
LRVPDKVYSFIDLRPDEVYSRNSRH